MLNRLYCPLISRLGAKQQLEYLVHQRDFQELSNK